MTGGMSSASPIALDVAAFIGPYPFRHVPHPDVAALTRVLQREGIGEAWVGYLPSAWHRDPSDGNALLFDAVAGSSILHAAPVIRPDWPRWEVAFDDALALGARAIRAYPPQWGCDADAPAMRRLAAACATGGIPLVLTVRFEDARQRHWMDAAGDLPAAAVRGLARATPDLRLVIGAAGRTMIEEVHWGLTPAERERIWWDISWIWGPPGDDLAHLFETLGAARFVFGSMWPLRLVQGPIANLAVLPRALSDLALGDPRGPARAPSGRVA
jgi:hypothetical protein